MKERIDLIIDTDPGVDDALAIMLAASQPHVNLLALTTVHGNVGLSQTTRNAAKVLDVIESDAAIYPGCARPLVYLPTENATRVHGEDGLGDVGIPESQRRVKTEHAAQAIVRMAREAPGRLTLAAIGPLTNLAVALRLEPDLPRLFKRLVIMGGAVTGRGNVLTGCAEFNVYSDPEAARIVFDEWGDFELADWEATVRHGFPLETLQEWRALDTPRAEFYGRISGRVAEFVQRRGETGQMRAADALALSVVVEPDIVQESEVRYARVETDGASRGLTWVDWENRLDRRANARIVLRVDQDRFMELMRGALLAG